MTSEFRKPASDTTRSSLVGSRNSVVAKTLIWQAEETWIQGRPSEREHGSSSSEASEEMGVEEKVAMEGAAAPVPAPAPAPAASSGATTTGSSVRRLSWEPALVAKALVNQINLSLGCSWTSEDSTVLRNQAATKIQARQRGNTSRKSTDVTREETKVAATKIQSRFRGNRARKKNRERGPSKMGATTMGETTVEEESIPAPWIRVESKGSQESSTSGTQRQTKVLSGTPKRKCPAEDQA